MNRVIRAIALTTLTMGLGMATADGGCSHCGTSSGCSSCGQHAAPCAQGGCQSCAPAAVAGCGCSSIAAGCCGTGFGLAQAGQLYAWQSMQSGYGVSAGYGMTGSGLTGYEGLPNMDGGGTHDRLPYHSYRRPWFHPGPPSKNISIVW
ncbi:MAG: hypothetical protein KDA85_06685 [Planctomycetaceae bacterium]|nr:hypothetical protein [Planctomycetaceae bacterium]